jgi:hypothetical protein
MPAVELLRGSVVGVGEQRYSLAPSRLSELDGCTEESRSCPATASIWLNHHILQYRHPTTQRCRRQEQ